MLRTVLALLLVAPLSSAELTIPQALSQLKSASKTQLATFKADTKTALATLNTDLAAIEDTMRGEDHPSDIALFVGNATVTFYTSAENAWSNAVEQMSAAVAGVLGDLADGSDLAGIYPASAYAGSGGVLDAHRKSLLRAALKVRDSAVKRLAKTAKLVESELGFSMNVRLNFPAAALAFSVNQQTSSQIDEGARINLVIALSALDESADGVIMVEGTTGSTADDVSVAWQREFGETATDDVSADGATGHFQKSFSGLVEGGYAISVRQTAGPVHDVAEIGVR